MANYAYLFATNTKQPCDVHSQFALPLRTVRYIVPLLWFGCFRQMDVSKHNVECINSRGERGYFQAVTLYARRNTVLSSFREFATQLVASRAITLPAKEYLQALYSDLSCVDCHAFQLDSSELQMLISPEEFDVWLSKGLEFSEKVASGAWANVLVLDERRTSRLAELFELAHIYSGTGNDPTEEKREEPSNQDFFDHYPERKQTVQLAVADKQEEIHRWECSDWQQSLIGYSA